MLIVFARDLCEQIGRRLAPLPIMVYSANTLAELADLTRGENVFQVVILPATLPDAETSWWEISGELALLNEKPEMLVFAHTANFRLWSSVLDAGGRDVLTDSLSSAELQSAVLLALQSFEERMIQKKTSLERKTD